MTVWYSVDHVRDYQSATASATAPVPIIERLHVTREDLLDLLTAGAVNHLLIHGRLGQHDEWMLAGIEHDDGPPVRVYDDDDDEDGGEG